MYNLLYKRLFIKYLEAFEKDKKIDLLSIAIDLDDMQEQLFLSEILQKKINREKAEEGFLETVQKILDRKWQASFGEKSNYTISDAPPSPNDIQIEKAVPPSGIISLAEAVAIATAHNRDYQTRKEQLYSQW